jgi:hypothetical protein
VLLTGLAGVAALAARPRSAPSTVVRVSLVGGPAVIVAALWAWAGADHGAVVYAAASGLPFVAYTTALVYPPGARRATIQRWVTIAAAVALCVPMMYAQLVVGIVAGQLLMRAAGYDLSYDGLPFLPGAAILGIPLALLLAARAAGLGAVAHAEPVPPAIAG